MTQPLFKIGSVYRQQDGRIVRLHAPSVADSDGRPLAATHVVDSTRREGHRVLETGREWDQSMLSFNRDLIPGELQCVNGEWIPITEQPMSVYFADAQEDEPAEGMPVPSDPGQAIHFELDYIDPLDAEMIARDGPAATKPAVVALPAAPTAKPAIAGLTCLTAVDHRLGARVVHGD